MIREEAMNGKDILMMQSFIGNKACRGAAKKLLLTVGIALLASQATTAQDVTECDRLAAVPGDPEAVAPGVEFWNLNIDAAIMACEESIKTYPDIERLSFQLTMLRLYEKARIGDSLTDEITALKRLSSNRYSHAAAMLGQIYKDGEYAETDLEIIEEYLERAKDLGNLWAEVGLGILYTQEGKTGRYTEIKVLRGERYLQRAVNRGNPQGQIGLAAYIQDTEPDRAFKLLEEAAEVGSPVAMLIMYVQQKDKKGPKYNIDRAKYWLNAAVNTGYPAAIYTLALEYGNGLHFEKNIPKAVNLHIQMLNFYARSGSKTDIQSYFEALPQEIRQHVKTYLEKR
jgi:hypothetical protein